ncbi:hypothetical protein [Pelotomaculum propionicicum]|uniref:hypothetical protein n=1 Tax=Pelotomaculum propionicicum TaxID=258475 RepID=UPI003B9EF5A0
MKKENLNLRVFESNGIPETHQTNYANLLPLKIITAARDNLQFYMPDRVIYYKKEGRK